ncbi:ABC transporter substrate-binding protein [Saccharothrix stipae]
MSLPERLPRGGVRRSAMTFVGVAGLVGALLTGCGTDGQPASASVTRLTFWSGYAGPAPTALEAIVDEFNSANPDVRIEVSLMPWDVFFQNLLPAYSSEGGPDLAAFDSTRVAQYAKKGVLAPVDDWFAADPASNALVTAAVDAVTYQGVKYAVPMTFTSLKLCYNRALFTEAGLDPVRPPTTWDQWRNAMIRSTSDDDDDGVPEQYGLAIPDHETIPVWPILLWGHGGDLLEPDGSKSALTRPESIAAVRTWTDLVTRKKVSPTGLSGAEAEELFRTGKAAMTITGPWATSGFQDAGVDFDLAPVPPGPIRQATLGSTTSLALSATLTPEKKRAAQRFLSYWVGEQAQESWMKGSGYPSIRLDQYAPNDNPLVGEFADDARIAQPLMPGTVEFAKIHDDVFEPAIRDVVSGKIGVNDGMAAASRRIDEILAASG